jgi:hypothetical protein
MKYSIKIIIAACLLCIPAKSFSSETFAKIGPEVRYIGGDSTYHISFDNPWAAGGHGESELEWPLDNWFGGINYLGGNKGAHNQIKNQFGLRLLGRISEDAGTMKDSDWIENDTAFGFSSHPGKDLYGEVDAELEKGLIFDVNYAYNFSLSKNFSIGPMLGFAYKKFKWSGENLVQRNYGPYVAWNYTDTNGWEWITYEVTYKMPYLGVNSEILFGENNQFRLNLSFAYSDWVDVSDEDTHLYPSSDAPGFNYDMISKGDCEGEAYIVRMETSWNFRRDWSLDIGGEYVDIDTEGSLEQRHYINGSLVGISVSPIEEGVTSSHWSAMLSVSYYL